MLGLSRPLLAKIQILRDLDSKIDFARSTIQLHIVFALMISRNPLTPTQIADAIEERRKAVLDALRKLEAKNIVAREGSRGGEALYVLSDEGKAYADKLLSFLGLRESIKIRSDEVETSGRSILVRKITEAYHIYRAIVFLANAPDKALSLQRLSELMELSPERAKSYLDMFSKPPIRIFRRIGSRGSGIYYRLEEKGLSLYKRTPSYYLMRKSWIRRIRIKLLLRLGQRAKRELIMPPLVALFLLAAHITSYLEDHFFSIILLFSVFIVLCVTSTLLP